MDYTKLALKIAKKAHKGQFRHNGKTLYITHPIAVAQQIEQLGIEEHTPYLTTIALLHDVIEDSNITLKDLETKFPIFVTIRIDMLTKKKNQSYLDYILLIKEDSWAKIVKIEDIKHNLSTLDKKNKTMRDKYELALYILESRSQANSLGGNF